MHTSFADIEHSNISSQITQHEKPSMRSTTWRRISPDLREGIAGFEISSHANLRQLSHGNT